MCVCVCVVVCVLLKVRASNGGRCEMQRALDLSQQTNWNVSCVCVVCCAVVVLLRKRKVRNAKGTGFVPANYLERKLCVLFVVLLNVLV